MREMREFIGYAVGIAVLTVAIALGINAISLEVARYMPAQSDHLSGSTGGPGAVPEASLREAGAPPVWIAPTPKYQYDPKLMEVKPLHERRKEAELRRQQEQAKYRATQREASQRQKRNVQAAREAFAFAGPPERPAFLMFSPH